MDATAYPVLDGRLRPDVFYKYLGPRGAEAVLETLEVRLSSPLTFNDPFDLQVDLRFDFSHEEFREAYSEAITRVAFDSSDAGLDRSRVMFPFVTELKKLAQEHPDSHSALRAASLIAVDRTRSRMDEILERCNQDWRSWLANLRLFCMAEVNDSLLMWSHYAGRHTGAVLEIHGSSELDTFTLAAQPVIYSDELPSLMNLENWVRVATAQHNTSVFRHYVLTKSRCWEYEREWRAFAEADDPGSEYRHVQLEPSEISAVYLGCCCSTDTATRVRELVSANLPHCRVYRAKRSPTRFALDFEAE